MNFQGMRGLDVLDVDLDSILRFIGVDSSSGVDPSTFISKTSTLTMGSLVLDLSSSSTILPLLWHHQF